MQNLIAIKPSHPLIRPEYLVAGSMIVGASFTVGCLKGIKMSYNKWFSQKPADQSQSVLKDIKTYCWYVAGAMIGGIGGASLCIRYLQTKIRYP